MAVVAICVACSALLIAVLAMILRKPGPQGPQGERGERGLPGEDGHDGIDGRDARFKLTNGHLFVTYVQEPSDEQWIDLGKVQGPKGPKGDPGKDGKDAVVVNTEVLTKDQVINLLSDGDEIVVPQPVVAPSFHQKNVSNE